MVIRSAMLAGALLFSVAVLIADMKTGPFIRMPVLFVFPVIAVSWFAGLISGQAFAIGLPLIRMFVALNASMSASLFEDKLINTAILVMAFSTISFLVYYVNRQRAKITILEGLLPICSFCKKIRTKDESWEQLEKYITRHSQAEFTHSVCPECVKKHYGDYIGGKNETVAKS